MPRYAERADLYKLGIPQARLGASVSNDEQDEQLDAASEDADSYLAKRYDLPLTTWPVSLKKAVCKVAAFELMRTVGMNPESMNDAVIVKAKDDALKWLQKIADGQAELVLKTGEEAADQTPDDDLSLGYVVSDPPRRWR